MKLLPLILSASSMVLADKTLSYSCHHNNSGAPASKDGYRVSKAGGSISDASAEKIIKDMPTWSDGRYLAWQNPAHASFIGTACKDNVESKERALEAMEDQEWIVKRQIRGESGNENGG